jgi:probable rRNA maturation factor
MTMAGTIEVELNSQQTVIDADPAQLTGLVRRVLKGEGIESAEISIALVDDHTIHRLNKQFLGHDYATDVLSFPLSHEAGHLEGEIVVSAETAAREAVRYGWAETDELLLYVVHGTLHLAGYDDADDDARQQMRRREAEYLGQLGLKPRYDEEEPIP